MICCISPALIASHHFAFRIFYDPVRLPVAIAAGGLCRYGMDFHGCPLNVGHLPRFCSFTVVLGYPWLNACSYLNYHLARRGFRKRLVDRFRARTAIGRAILHFHIRQY